MRVPMVLFALVLTPLVAVSAQAPNDNRCKEKPTVGNSVPARAAAPGQVKKCPVAPPPPPVTPPPPPPADTQPTPPPPDTGLTGAEIQGAAFADADVSFSWTAGETGLAGWTITLSGPVSASTVTDDAGTYRFVGLPPGTYIVCQAPQIGWWQTVPLGGAECPSGMMGYARVVSPDAPTVRFIGNDFGNAPIQ